MIIYLELLSPTVSSDPPKSATGSRIAFYSVLLRMEFTCALSVTRKAVVSYTAFPPLPDTIGRFISVALALESPPPDVIRHPALRSPDFPHPRKRGREHLPHLPYHYILTFFILSNIIIIKYYFLYLKIASSNKFSDNRILWQVFRTYAQEIT